MQMSCPGSGIAAGDLAKLAWAFGTSGLRELHFEPLAEGFVMLTDDQSSNDPEHVAKMVWAAAKVGYGSVALMDRVALQVQVQVAEFRPSSLANIAWSFATLAYLVPSMMAAISSEVLRGIHRQDARDLANLAFAFATLCQLKEDEPLKEALSEEVLKKLNWIQPQSLAFLTEVGLEASTHPFLLQKLNEILDHLVTALATREATSAWKRRVEAALQELYLDHLGSVGSHLLLSRLQIDAPDQDFILRAMQSFPTCAGRTRGLETQRPQQRRIFAYSEHRLQTTDATGGRDATAGRMLREHGFQGLRRWQKGWLKPLTLPVNHYVDRSVCAEFQVLNEICDLVNEEALADDMQSCALVEGVVQLLVSTAPCLSCISAALQFQLLFPKVHLQFGCVQPWSELPGGCEPFRSDEDLHAGAAAPSPPSPQQPAEAELSEAERADLSELCDMPIDARSWEELLLCLQRCSHQRLAEILRRKRWRVLSETVPERARRLALYQIPVFCIDGSIDWRGCQEEALMDVPWTAAFGLLKVSSHTEVSLKVTSLFQAAKLEEVVAVRKLRAREWQRVLNLDVLLGAVLFLHCHVLSLGGRCVPEREEDEVVNQVIATETPPPTSGEVVFEEDQGIITSGTLAAVDECGWEQGTAWYPFDETGRYDVDRSWLGATPPTLEEWEEEGSPVEACGRNAGLTGGRKAEVRGFRPEVQLSEGERQSLQSFIQRFDACAGLEATLQLLQREVHSFFGFQACKVLQRFTKKFGAAGSKDNRLHLLLGRCAAAMSTADGISLGRALWSLGRLHLRHEALLQAAAARLPELLDTCGPITIATVWHAFEVLQFEDAKCLEALVQDMEKRLWECDPPEVSIVLHAAAQLAVPKREGLFEKLLEYVRQRSGRFSARHLAVCLHAAAKVGLRDEALCQMVTDRFRAHIADTDALALTSAVYACGLVAYFQPDFFESVAAWLLRQLRLDHRRIESQQISNMVYSFGKLGFKSEQLLMACAQNAMQEFWRFKPQELDNLTYGMALLKWRHEPYLNALAQHLVEGGRVRQLDCQSLVSMAYSSALLGYANPVMLRALGDQAIPKLLRFKAEEFSIMVYSLGVLNFRHHDLLAHVVQLVPAALPKFTTQNMSNLLHGLGLVSFDRDDDFVRHVCDHLSSRFDQATAQDIANPITALMRMCIPHERFFRQVAAYITAPSSRLPLKDFTPQEIANTIYGFDALQVFDVTLFEQTQREISKRVEEFIPQEAANVLWAVAKQGLGSVDFFEELLRRMAPFAEAQRPSGPQRMAVEWGAEDLEKPLAALRPWRHQLPSYERLDRVFRTRFLSKIAQFLMSLSPASNMPLPSQYQKDFAAWDLYQVGPDYTEELLRGVGVLRHPWRTDQELLRHYVGNEPDSLLSRYGEKLLISVLPAARWVSSRLFFRLASPSNSELLEGALLVEPAHPKEDDEANQRRFGASATSWREELELSGGNGHAPFRPVLLSTFLGNWRHRHTEVVALDLLVDRVLQALQQRSWRWHPRLWEDLEGEVELLVPHTPCLSCVGAFTQLKRWAPRLRIAVLYQDWRDWRKLLRDTVAQRAT
ncbi:unnamed protein product [Durusdinium trenchii]|uniref:RNA-editing substrate-binding complex 6 protein domain-containing protein n=1 Tax=Durusdinium trenchii TaxID=1381693 RepID=A0ABP0NR65_9DINO